MSRTIIGRIFLFLGGLLVLGIVLRLIGGVFAPVVPDSMREGLGAGWQELSEVMGPAIPAIAALVILGGIIWIILGWSGRRRRI